MRLSFLSLFLLLSFPLSLLSQSEEEEDYPFPDDISSQINQQINIYQEDDYERTKFYTLELLNHARKCEEEELLLLSYTALEFYSYYFNQREDFDKITIETDSIFKSMSVQQISSIFADYYFDHLNYYSIYLFRKNKISEASTLISNAINLLENNTFEQATKSYYLSVFYASLSFIKELQWNFSEGLKLLEKAKHVDKKSAFSSAYINTNLSRYHLKMGNYYEALDYAKLSLEKHKSAIETDTIYQDLRHYLQSLNRLVELYVYVGLPTKAQSYLDELNAFPLKKYPLVQMNFFQNFAKINLLENKLDLALENYQKYLKIQQEKQANRIVGKVKVQKSIAQIYYKKNQLDSTFHYLQQAIIELTNSPNLNDIEANPLVFDKVIYKQSLLDILQEKTALLLDKFAQSMDICDLKTAQQTSESAQNLADKIRLDLSSDFDKELFSKKANKIYTQAVKIASLLEEIEHSNSHLNFAYRAIESSRALLLAEAVYQSNAKEFAGVPRDFTRREEDFRAQIMEKDRQIFQLEQEGEEAISYLEEKWQLQLSFDKFIDSLEALYPDYYKLKFAVQRPSIEELQKDLKLNKQTLIEYFLGDEKIYALIVSEDRYELKHWQYSKSLQDYIRRLRSAIYEAKDYTKSVKDFTQYASELYGELILPLGDLPNRLVIVPDGVLNYLPFDVLLTEKPEIEGNYQDYKFLLREKQISYDYSANMKMQKRHSIKKQNDFLGFAPQYGENNPTVSRGVGNLKYNIKEVEEITAKYAGISFIGDNASVQKFKEKASKAWILHFAGHAVQEEIKPDFSHLLFSGKTNKMKNNQLPVREIYAQSISAEMVVLSACDTGMGTIQQGEGMYSLGRAFSYAGANSLISTLWSVNDESTAKIMIDFYDNLKSGMTKDEALQAAKIMYIDSTDTHKDSQPLYWAGFVAFGNMQDLDFAYWFSNW